MGHGPCAFKQTDVTRAIKAAQAAGLKVTGFEITTDGKITVVASAENGTTTATANEWDSVYGEDQAPAR
jgi:hypothetical protein